MHVYFLRMLTLKKNSMNETKFFKNEKNENTCSYIHNEWQPILKKYDLIWMLNK